MSVLYILGAGCSRSYDQCDSPVGGLKPPLNSDFFKMARKVVDHYGISHMYGPIVGLGHLIREINELYGYGNSEDDTTGFDDPRLSLEGVMNHFYLKLQIFSGGSLLNDNSTASSRTRALNELLAYTLAEALSGPVCTKHVRLADRMRRGLEF